MADNIISRCETFGFEPDFYDKQTERQATAAQELDRVFNNYTDLATKGKISIELLKAASIRQGQGLETGMKFYAPYLKNGQRAELNLKLRGLTLIGARTGGGKTLSLVNIAAHVLASQPDKHLLFVTLEDDKFALIQKLILAYVTITGGATFDSADLFFMTNMEQDEYIQQSQDTITAANRYDRFSEVVHFINDHVVFYDISVISASTVGTLAGFIAEHQRLYSNNAVIFLDYFQLLNSGMGKDGYAEIKKCIEILRPFFSKGEQNIIAAVQFNREVKPKREEEPEERAKSEFQNAIPENIREAADLEQAASCIIYAMKHETKHGTKEHFKILKMRGKGQNFTMACPFDSDCYALKFKEGCASDLSKPSAQDSKPTGATEDDADKEEKGSKAKPKKREDKEIKLWGLN